MPTSHLGGWLTRAREARGLTVDAVASHTKIPPRHIEAFERGDTLDLPPFYQRAEIRTVARALGLDEQMAVARLEALLAPVEPPIPAPVEPATRVRSEYVLATLGTGIVLVALVGWDSYGRTAASESAVDTRRATSAPRHAPAPPPAASTRNHGARTAVVHSVGTAAVESPVANGPTELVIRTLPEGARVTVNGIGWGPSPVTIKHLEPGEKRIRVTMDGYTSAERSLTIDDGARRTISIRLAESGS